MKTLLVTTPHHGTEAKKLSTIYARVLTDWHVETSSAASLNRTNRSPDVTLVEVNRNTRPAEINTMLSSLVHLQAKSPHRSYVLFSFSDLAKVKLRGEHTQKHDIGALLTQIYQRLSDFPDPDRVNVTFAETPANIALYIDHFRAKLDLAWKSSVDIPSPRVTPRPSPVDRVKEAISATEDLRVPNGNLSAEAVAKAFGISLNQLAGYLGRTRQTVNKTPDADSLQEELAFFERVARLRTVITPEGFLKWLRMPNPELDNKQPLDLLASGERQVVADLVDDMLTGAPV